MPLNYARSLTDRQRSHGGAQRLGFALTYGDSIRTDLAKAIQNAQTNPRRLLECMDHTGMAEVPTVVWRRIKVLGRP